MDVRVSEVTIAAVRVQAEYHRQHGDGTASHLCNRTYLVPEAHVSAEKVGLAFQRLEEYRAELESPRPAEPELPDVQIVRQPAITERRTWSQRFRTWLRAMSGRRR